VLSVQLSPELEKTVDQLVAAGRYGSKSEVLREGIRLVDERERRQQILSTLLGEAIAQSRAGAVVPVDEFFDELLAEYEEAADVSR
jgi:antitoxin ParD1/3/4